MQGPNVMKRKFDPHFPLKHMQKDMQLALAMGHELNTSMPTPSPLGAARQRDAAGPQRLVLVYAVMSTSAHELQI